MKLDVEKVLTIDEAAERLKVCAQTIRRAVKQGDLGHGPGWGRARCADSIDSLIERAKSKPAGEDS
jgi:excisionase family DNA binding protein